jgi:periplasmic protein TonB
MRKVYHNEKSSLGVAVAIIFSLGLTLTIFCIIPFTHIIAKPGKNVELRKASAADLPPPQEDKMEAPPPEAEKEQQEAPPEPQLADAPQQIPITADLDVAVGSGGALSGFGEVRALTAAQAIQDETFDVSELEKRPEAVSQVAPTYPTELRKAKIEGSVTLAFVLNEGGRVEDARVENSSRPEFEKPALEAIRKWRFRPGMKDGQAVRTFVRIPMKFRVSSG